MPVVPINYLSIAACVVSNMILGFLWYGPLFGTQWMKLMKIDPKSIDKAKMEGMWKTYLLTAFGALVMAYVMAHSLYFASTFFNIWGIQAGLTTAFWNWLGFIAPVTMSSVLFEGKPWALWVLNNAYQLLTLLIMGTILSVWP